MLKVRPISEGIIPFPLHNPTWRHQSFSFTKGHFLEKLQNTIRGLKLTHCHHTTKSLRSYASPCIWVRTAAPINVQTAQASKGAINTTMKANCYWGVFAVFVGLFFPFHIICVNNFRYFCTLENNHRHLINTRLLHFGLRMTKGSFFLTKAAAQPIIGEHLPASSPLLVRSLWQTGFWKILNIPILQFERQYHCKVGSALHPALERFATTFWSYQKSFPFRGLFHHLIFKPSICRGTAC